MTTTTDPAAFAGTEPVARPTAVPAAPGGRTGHVSVRVKQLRWESDAVISLLLQDATGAPLPDWEPGAHIDLHLPGSLVRQYSLCGDPTDATSWRVAVLLEPGGRGGSRAVHELVRPGALLTAAGPRNHFALRPARRYRLVAGGIGITPIMTMAAEASRRGAEWSLLYGGRHRSSMAFVDEVRALAGSGSTVAVHPQDEAGLLPLDEAFAEVEDDTLVYCCGPEPLLQAVARATAHWPEGSLVVERFAAVARGQAGDEDLAFEVEAAASGVSVTVSPGQSIVQALEAVGVHPEVSCEEGICGTCETRVLQGVPAHRDSLLSPQERELGETMMICVSRCRGERLVLDL